MDASTPQPRRMSRFDGWQLGVLAVSLGLISSWLALPRPVDPELLPLPQVDRRELAYTLRKDEQRADAVERVALPFEVRAVGELVRRTDALLARGELRGAASMQRELTSEFARVRQHTAAERLATLRAVQASLFERAVARWQTSRHADAELAELGANFPEQCARMGWLDGNQRLLLTPAELHTLFIVRWTELTGSLHDAELRPTLDELRLYYRVLLQYAGSDQAADRDEQRLRIVRAFASIDNSYPVDFARGVLLFRLGRAQAAFAAFSQQLSTHPNGPWAQRAKNHALAAYALLPDAD